MTGLVLSSELRADLCLLGRCGRLAPIFWSASGTAKPEAAAAAKKAFLVNRIGDFGFAIALFWMWVDLRRTTT